jgi:hypothetical protein
MDAATFWPVFLAVAALLGIAVLAMAVGTMLSGKCLRGSCGGPEAVGPDGESLSCATCPNRKRRADAPREA